MAAPIVSGAALILREYFLEQYAKLCTTTYTYCKSFTPSGLITHTSISLLEGYLLKAILIHSAIPITRYDIRINLVIALGTPRLFSTLERLSNPFLSLLHRIIFKDMERSPSLMRCPLAWKSTVLKICMFWMHFLLLERRIMFWNLMFKAVLNLSL